MEINQHLSKICISVEIEKREVVYYAEFLMSSLLNPLETQFYDGSREAKYYDERVISHAAVLKNNLVIVQYQASPALAAFHIVLAGT